MTAKHRSYQNPRTSSAISVVDKESKPVTRGKPCHCGVQMSDKKQKTVHGPVCTSQLIHIRSQSHLVPLNYSKVQYTRLQTFRD